METLHQLAATHPYWSLEEFAMIANQWLPRVLPESKANTRVREDVNPRLIRQYTTWGLVDAPGKEGREARYGYRHLVQLLVTRRLLADGYATAVIHRLVAGQDDASLESMLAGGAQLTVATEPNTNPAIAFLQGLTQRGAPASKLSSFGSAPAAKKKAAAPHDEPALMKEAFRRDRSAPEEAEQLAEARDEFLHEDMAMDEGRSLFAEAAAPPPAPPMAAPSRAAMAPAPAPAPAPAAMPLLSPLSPSPVPERWLRLGIAPGLELGVREDAELPDTPAERQALAELILERLKHLSSGQ